MVLARYSISRDFVFAPVGGHLHSSEAAEKNIMNMYFCFVCCKIEQNNHKVDSSSVSNNQEAISVKPPNM